MSSSTIEGAIRLAFIVQQDHTGEQLQYGFHTGGRSNVQYGALQDVMSEWWTSSLPSTYAAACHLVRTVIAEWGSGPGFTGWHQVNAVDRSAAGGSGPILPPQCSVVVGVRSNDVDVPLRSRRNRSYLGLLATGVIDANGQLTTAQQGGLVTTIQDLQDLLIEIPVAAGFDGLEGLSVASPSQGVLITGNVSAVGLGIDTQRSRRQKVAEATLITQLT